MACNSCYVKVQLVSSIGLVLLAGASLGSVRSAAAPTSPWLRITEVRLLANGGTGIATRVVTVTRNGSRSVVLTSPTGWSAVSPDGRYRAWYAHGNDRTRVLVAPTAGGTAKTVAVSACASPKHPCATGSALAWSRTNVLAFMSYGDLDDRKTTLGVALGDGTVLRRYSYPGTNAAGRQLDYYQGEWSPDGRRLLFVRTEFDGPKDVYVVDTKTWAVRRVFRTAHFKDHPVSAWSPDSRSLAFVTQGWDRPRDPVFAVVNAATGRVVVRKAFCEDRPECPNGAGVVWSPDGRQVAYATSTGIARARQDLSTATSVLASSTPPLLQRWTPDGLFAVDFERPKVVAINPETGSTRTIYTPPRGWLSLAVAAVSG